MKLKDQVIIRLGSVIYLNGEMATGSVRFSFLFNNFGLLGPTMTRLGVYEAYLKRKRDAVFKNSKKNVSVQ